MGSPLVEYTAAEIATHNSPSDSWLVIHGEVYDVSKYAHDHPGGIDVLLEAAGTDATQGYEDAGHSEDALEIMQTLRVGILKGYKKPAPKMRSQTLAPRLTPATTKSNASSSSATAVVQTAALTAVAAVSLAEARLFVQNILRASPMPTHTHTGTTGGFTSGFLAASAIASVLGGVAVKQLSKATHIKHGFAQFAPHKKSVRPPQPDVNALRGFLDPKTYQSLPLVRKDEVAPNVFRLLFALPTPQTVLGLPTGQHVAIRATVKGQVVTRSYTPVSMNVDQGVLELLIRCYPDGLLTGQYLAHLKVGDEVEFRGPRGSMRYWRGLASRIGMLAGGTGITPMFQLIRAICEDPRDTTQVSLVYANRSPADMLLREELEGLARRHPKNLQLWYMIDRKPEEGEWEYGVGYVTREVLEKRFPKASDEAKIMLCGPPGMVGAAKKMLAEMGFMTPGASPKMDDQIFCF
ncbi:hypothetical protein B0H63DRAFT_542317, partial [Podospora didyma]